MHTEDSDAVHARRSWPRMTRSSSSRPPAMSLEQHQQAAFERYIQGGGGYTGIHAAADTEYDVELVRPPRRRLLPAAIRPGRRTRRSTSRTTTTPRPPGLPDPLASAWTSGTTTARPTSPTRRAGRRLQPARARRRAHARHGRRVDLRRAGRQRHRRRSSDHLVPALRRRALVVHGHGPHRGLVLRARLPRAHPRAASRSPPASAASAECTNSRPSVQAAADPHTGMAPLAVQFTSSGTDPENQALTYAWDFGDGGRALGQNATHTYLTPGTYMAKVTVTDPDGGTGTAEVQVIVADPPGNQPPTVRAAADPRRATRRSTSASRRRARTPTATRCCTSGISATAARRSARRTRIATPRRGRTTRR